MQAARMVDGEEAVQLLHLLQQIVDVWGMRAG
jgi:hypothetical protein